VGNAPRAERSGAGEWSVIIEGSVRWRLVWEMRDVGAAAPRSPRRRGVGGGAAAGA
jgi:hypothetical protein